ncbi:hypothetical protein REPUB_Repub09cG0082100 [Reevesia pubescens]
MFHKFGQIGFPLANFPSSSHETTAIANTKIDWKETPKAHIFKAPSRVEERKVKVEVENDGSNQATMENGVLSVTVRKEEKKPEVIVDALSVNQETKVRDVGMFIPGRAPMLKSVTGPVVNY